MSQPVQVVGTGEEATISFTISNGITYVSSTDKGSSSGVFIHHSLEVIERMVLFILWETISLWPRKGTAANNIAVILFDLWEASTMRTWDKPLSISLGEQISVRMGGTLEGTTITVPLENFMEKLADALSERGTLSVCAASDGANFRAQFAPKLQAFLGD